MTEEYDTRPMFQVTLDLGISLGGETQKRYLQVHRTLFNLCFKPGHVISSSMLVKKDEYDPETHMAFIAMGQENAEEVERKAKESGLVLATHIDPIS